MQNIKKQQASVFMRDTSVFTVLERKALVNMTQERVPEIKRLGWISFGGT